MDRARALGVLGVDGDPDSAQIRAAYLDLVKVWHPDRFTGQPRLQARAQSELQRINVAYQVLSRDSGPRATAPPPRRAQAASPRNEPEPPHAQAPRSSAPRRPSSTSAGPARPRTGVLVAAILVVGAFSWAILILLRAPGGTGAAADVPTNWFEQHKAKMRAEFPGYDPLAGTAPTVTASPTGMAEPEPTDAFDLLHRALAEERAKPPSKSRPSIWDDIDQELGLRPAVPSASPEALGFRGDDPEKPRRTLSRERDRAADESSARTAASRPENDTLLSAPVARGRGILTVHNGTNTDAAVLLEDEAGGAYAKYVRAGARVSLEEVAPGTYSLRFMHGRGWLGDRFAQDSSYSAFDRELVFKEIDTGNSIRFQELSVTLHSVKGGNARTKSVAPFRLPVPIP